jgi:hypothetical protein
LFRAFALTLLFSATPVATSAQVDIQARFGVQIGFVVPHGSQFVRQIPASDRWEIIHSFTGFPSYPTLGLSLGIGDPVRGFMVRGYASRSLGLRTDLLGVGFNTCHDHWEVDGDCGPWEEFEWHLDAAVTEAGFDMVFPTGLGLGPVKPHIALGAGVRRYDFFPSADPEWLEFDFPPGETTWSVRAGGGIDFGFRGRDYSVTAMDRMSRYWGELRHHLSVQVGVPLVAKHLFTLGRGS